ncbi:MAG: carboxylating nicotinate-nucleotide diphosphorylase [Clostridiales bacterium]|nr:carboxylating nicotinate-nucleotide diphosphorylase [Clostridiales bacterium]
MNILQYRAVVAAALSEDLSFGDRTTDSIFRDEQAIAEIVTRETGVVAGLTVAAETFAQVDSRVLFTPQHNDGDSIKPGDCLARIEGPIAAILKGERTALNFLQRMSGIATMTQSAVQQLTGTLAKVTDTRKTTPGLRILEKYAVRVGGGENHRFHLGDMVLIKDNHIRGAGSIKEAVSRVREHAGFTVKIEVEAASLADVKEALSSNVEIIMLDNMTNEEMSEAVKMVAGQALVEASGGITLTRLREVAETGVDIISLGYLTHGYRALDLSLNIV